MNVVQIQYLKKMVNAKNVHPIQENIVDSIVSQMFVMTFQSFWLMVNVKNVRTMQGKRVRENVKVASEFVVLMKS